MSTTIHQPSMMNGTPRSVSSAGPVCDHCRTAHSPAGWQAAEDGAQLCQRCWLAMQSFQAVCPHCRSGRT